MSTQSYPRQVLTTSVFTSGEIYATAFASAAPNSFHYTLSVIQSPTTCIKYHAKEASPKNFIFESLPQFKFLNVSESLCVAVKIGKTDRSDEELIKLFETIPMTIPTCDQETDGYFRCRVWLKQAIRALHDADIISCPDADVVVNGELRKLAEANYDSITLGTGSAQVFISQNSV